MTDNHQPTKPSREPVVDPVDADANCEVGAYCPRCSARLIQPAVQTPLRALRLLHELLGLRPVTMMPPADQLDLHGLTVAGAIEWFVEGRITKLQRLA